MTKEELLKKAVNDEEAVLRLAEIIRMLREPGGCPWDREQTHESLKRPMIEEAYEVIEAIEIGDDDNLREELGDVLLQVIFHANIAKTENRFTLADIANEECEKMIRRHPHVFGDVANDKNAKEVLAQWEDIKKLEKKSNSQTESMNSIPRRIRRLIKITTRQISLQEKEPTSSLFRKSLDLT